jgi:transposase, IS5 family
MAHKNMDIKQMTFGDLSIENSINKNRTYQLLSKLDNLINWSKIEKILKKDYPVGKNERGQKAFNPLVLFKCLLLQKWFRIESDPELESQINDRISFRKFINFTMEEISPDHSTFSRFRNRLPQQSVDKINNEILNQFAKKGISINEGIAVDARLVKSVSKPISNDKSKALKESISTNRNKSKFTRDLDSDWTRKNDKLHYGLKEHAAVDIKNGFVLSTTLSPASHNDYNYFSYCVATSRHTDKPLKVVYADKGYTGKSNSVFLAMNKIKDCIMRKNTKNTRLTDYEKERNKKISKKRYIVEQYFGLSHLHNGASKARFTTIVKNKLDTVFRQIAFNMKKGLKVLPAF